MKRKKKRMFLEVFLGVLVAEIATTLMLTTFRLILVARVKTKMNKVESNFDDLLKRFDLSDDQEISWEIDKKPPAKKKAPRKKA